jgi:hypothetical protein
MKESADKTRLMAFCEIDTLIPLTEPDDKTRIFRTLLKGQASLEKYGTDRRLRCP